MPDIEVNDDRLEYEWGSNVFGWLPILMGGLFAATGGVFALFSLSWSGEASMYALSFGGLFGLLGAGASGFMGVGLLAGHGLVIDRSRGVVTKWWGLFRPMTSTSYALEDFDAVTFTVEKRRCREQTLFRADAYIAQLHGPAMFEFCAAWSEEQPRQFARMISAFAGLPLVDRTGDEEQILHLEPSQPSGADTGANHDEANRRPDQRPRDDSKDDRQMGGGDVDANDWVEPE